MSDLILKIIITYLLLYFTAMSIVMAIRTFHKGGDGMSYDTHYQKVTKIKSRQLDREVVLPKPIYAKKGNWDVGSRSTNELILIAMEQILQRLDDIEKKLDEHNTKTSTISIPQQASYTTTASIYGGTP